MPAICVAVYLGGRVLRTSALLAGISATIVGGPLVSTVLADEAAPMAPVQDVVSEIAKKAPPSTTGPANNERAPKKGSTTKAILPESGAEEQLQRATVRLESNGSVSLDEIGHGAIDLNAEQLISPKHTLSSGSVDEDASEAAATGTVKKALVPTSGSVPQSGSEQSQGISWPWVLVVLLVVGSCIWLCREALGRFFGQSR